MQNKTMMRCHHTPIRRAKIKKIVVTTNAGEDVKKLNHSHIAGGNVKWYSRSGKPLTLSQKTQELYSWAFIPEK